MIDVSKITLPPTHICATYTVRTCPKSKFFPKGPFSVCQTIEHAYQWHACMEHINTELAEKVMNAKSPRDATQIAAKLKGMSVYVTGGVFDMKS